MANTPPTLVLLSGGLDSATCLAIARRDADASGAEAHAITCDVPAQQTSRMILHGQNETINNCSDFTEIRMATCGQLIRTMLQDVSN